MDEYSRFKKIVPENIYHQLTNKTVLVLGLGGVGSYTVTSLARCNINKLILVDYDTIDITNINRQIHAFHSTVGQKKTDVLERIIKDINPNIEVIKINEKITPENINILFQENIDYIVDACDTVTTKISIIKESFQRNIKLIVATGTGNKFDPSKLKITTLNKTTNDPLSKVLRHELKNEKFYHKIICVTSTELPVKTSDRTPGSNAFIPSIAGLMITSYIINDILKN